MHWLRTTERKGFLLAAADDRIPPGIIRKAGRGAVMAPSRPRAFHGPASDLLTQSVASLRQHLCCGAAAARRPARRRLGASIRRDDVCIIESIVAFNNETSDSSDRVDEADQAVVRLPHSFAAGIYASR
jgi:hypothetical protein